MTTSSNNQFSAQTSIGIDIAKDVFHIVGFDTTGQIALRRKIKRLTLMRAPRSAPLHTRP